MLRTTRPAQGYHPSSHHHHSHHHHSGGSSKHRVSGRRSQGYESDTGYRSDATYRPSSTGHRSDTGYLSDTGYRSDIVSYSSRSSRHQGASHSHSGGYSSDWDSLLVRHRSREGSGYVSDTGVGFYHGHPGYRPLSGPPGSSQSTSRSATVTGAGVVIANNRASAYNNIAQSRRTTIRNDELYEQQRSNNNSGKQRRDSDSRSTPVDDHRSVNEPIREEPEVRGATGGSEDDHYRAQIYKAAAKMSKSPADKKSPVSWPLLVIWGMELKLKLVSSTS